MVVDSQRITKLVHRFPPKFNGRIGSFFAELFGNQRKRLEGRGLAFQLFANLINARCCRQDSSTLVVETWIVHDA